MSNWVMVYRCQREEEFGGCGWSTAHYDEVDAHEEQLEPGHWVLGKVEQVDLLPVARQQAVEQVASKQVEQVDLLNLLEVAPEQAESKQVEQALAQADDEVNRELNEISHAAYAGSSTRNPERDVRFLLSLLSCHSGRDGECSWERCPQLRDGEPDRSKRHCPLDWHDEMM